MSPAKQRLTIIVASTRPRRVGLAVASWFESVAREHGGFDVALADLADLALPLLDEPEHPRLQRYGNDHTKRWSAIVAQSDAFVVVTPEYNFGSPPALVNALDYLYNEWNYKPMAFVSYGGMSGGIRSVQMSKQIATTLKLVPLVEAVAISFVAKHVADGAFAATHEHAKAATDMLDELRRWALALRAMRA